MQKASAPSSQAAQCQVLSSSEFFQMGHRDHGFPQLVVVTGVYQPRIQIKPGLCCALPDRAKSHGHGTLGATSFPRAAFTTPETGTLRVTGKELLLESLRGWQERSHLVPPHQSTWTSSSGSTDLCSAKISDVTNHADSKRQPQR